MTHVCYAQVDVRSRLFLGWLQVNVSGLRVRHCHQDLPILVGSHEPLGSAHAEEHLVRVSDSVSALVMALIIREGND